MEQTKQQNTDEKKLKEYQSSTSSKITPGYVKFVIDETTADYEYLKGLFSEEEIKEAFSTLDYNKDGNITAEDITFFLEYIGEQATEEEIEEMIKMCDADGNGEVSYDEFYKLASGQSLAPIGQSYPPTADMKKRSEALQKIQNNEFEDENKQTKKNNFFIEDFQGKTDEISKMKFSTLNLDKFSMQNDSQLKNSLLTAQSIQKLGGMQGTLKQTLINRKRLISKLFKDNQYGIEQLKYFIDYVRNISDDHVDYPQFIQFLNIEEDNLSKEIFVNLWDKNADKEKISLKDFTIMLVGVSQNTTQSKFELCFEIFGEQKILQEDLFRISEIIQFKIEFSSQKIEDKIKIKQSQPKYKNRHFKPEELDFELYKDLINSFPSVFIG